MVKALVVLFALCLGARATLTTAFVWGDAQPPVIATPTELSFHDSVHNTDVTLTALNGAVFTAHSFDPSFPSLPSVLGPLGTGKEDFSLFFLSGLSSADILVDANTHVLDSAGAIIDAVTIDGAQRIGTEEQTATGVQFTEQLSKSDNLDLSLTNFLFEVPVPEISPLLMIGVAVGAGALLLRRRLMAVS